MLALETANCPVGISLRSFPMCKRAILSGLIVGLLLAGAALASAAPSDPPAASESDKTAAKNITLVGAVEFDDPKLVRVSAKVTGRIDKVHVKLTGQKVK